MRKLIILSFILLSIQLNAEKRFSTAGFYAIENSPRKVYNMNPAWKFHKGDANGAEQKEFNDQTWQVVSLPNGMEVLPLDASACVNYQGVSWYRKHFTMDEQQRGKRIVLYFEGVMGKSVVWVNGVQVAQNFGGFLPFSADITEHINWSENNIIAVKADNSDDPDYPPGKPQATLDFSYFGGIYRDVWMYTTNSLYITDPIMANKVADGGLFVHYDEVSDESAIVNLSLNLKNENKGQQSGRIEYIFTDKKGEIVKKVKAAYKIKGGLSQTIKSSTKINKPSLWSPDSPTLYNLTVRVLDSRNKEIDSYRQRIGIRSIRFNSKDGLVLNGKPFPRKLIGANRHQDYATIGNALSNSLHWRDAKKLKDVGIDMIRNAHYPQDPAFMDACDELGLFVIVNTPGWQFWNDKDIFKQRVYQNIRDMVRRDRNSPTILMWEPILNETWYPDDFAKTVHNICKEEYPIKDCYTVGDREAKGYQHLDLQYLHPYIAESIEGYNKHKPDEGKVSLTREWGDNVDNWNSHNSVSRVGRNWGEIPQLEQAEHYHLPDYPFSCMDVLFRTPRSHIGGALWHSFDHQRGYHPDPFYGGIMDAFRRPKFSYEMFRSQSRQVSPMVFIANLMTPFSPQDVTVYSNCEEVRLHTRTGDTLRIHKQPKRNLVDDGAPSPIIKFEKAYHRMTDKYWSNKLGETNSYLLAEGLIDGKVVARHKITPARRPTKILLTIDTMGVAPIANGGDLVTVTASITDQHGNIKRLNNSHIRFEIEGEGRLIARDKSQEILWGDASVIVQTTTHAGKVRVKAISETNGVFTFPESIIEFNTQAPSVELLYNKEIDKLTSAPLPSEGKIVSTEQKTKGEKDLKQVEKQQAEFGEKRENK